MAWVQETRLLPAPGKLEKVKYTIGETENLLVVKLDVTSQNEYKDIFLN
jgi:hypothetical protein